MSIRILTAVSAGFAVISGIVAANLWHDLRSERELTAALRTDMAGSTGHVGALLPGPGTDTGNSVAPQDSADAVVVTTPPPPASAAAAIQGTSITEQDLLKDPEYREARLAELRSTIERSYPGLAEELGLTDEESGRLFGLLAETRLAMAAEGAIAGTQPVDPAAAAQITRNRRALQKQQSDSLRGLLGDARYAQWQDYQQTQSVRLQASTYATALARAGVPLDSAQTRTITMAMLAEQERLKEEILALGRSVTLAHPHTQAQAQEALKRRQQESSQHVLDAAARHLSAQQLDVLRRQIELQARVDRP